MLFKVIPNHKIASSVMKAADKKEAIYLANRYVSGDSFYTLPYDLVIIPDCPYRKIGGIDHIPAYIKCRYRKPSVAGRRIYKCPRKECYVVRRMYNCYKERKP